MRISRRNIIIRCLGTTKLRCSLLREQRYAVGSVMTLLQWELNVQFMFAYGHAQSVAVEVLPI